MSHPSLDELRAFSAGLLQSGVLKTITDHLDQCVTCREISDNFSHRDDLFFQSVQQAATEVSTSPRRIQMLVSTGEFDTGPNSQPAEIPYSTVAIEPDPFETAIDATSARQLPILEQFGDYELIAKIASGGMGIVYRARHRKLDRMVALKMIVSGDLASDDEVQRFHAEAAAAAQLEHPGIVPIYDVGEVDGRHYFSMALIEGGTLAALVEQGPLEARAAAALLEKVAAAIQFAHDQGIIHRDLKPANILLTRDGQPRVSDFGLAKRLELSGGITVSGQVMGTPQYMPPEQALGKTRQIGPMSDVYALGAVLYHLVTGHPPFQAANVVAILHLVIETDPVSPRRLNPTVEADLEIICLKCLEKDAKRRYASAAALQDDLNRFLAGEAILARRTPTWERALKWARRRPAVALLLAVSVLALVSTAAGGMFYAQMANQRAILLEKELAERKALDDSQRDAQLLLVRGEQAITGGILQEARVHVEKAIARIGHVPALEKERIQAEQLQQQLQSLLAAEADRSAARTRLSDFNRHRESALFYGSQFFGLDPQKNQELARREATAALAAFDLETREAGSLSLSRSHFSDQEISSLKSRCYEILLILADSMVRSLPTNGENRPTIQEALEVIDRATNFHGSITKAARLQKADYFALLDDPRASEERRQANDPATVPTAAADFFLVGKLQLRASTGQVAELLEARDNFEHALRLDPEHFWSQYCLAMCHMRMRRPDLAQVHLTACVARRPDFNWSYVLRGAAHSQSKEFVLAESDFRHVLELKGDDESHYVTLVNWGVMEFERNRVGEAEKLLQQAVVLRPGEFQAHLSLSKVLQRQQKLPAAIQSLNVAAGLQPKMPMVYRERARLLAQSSDWDAAAQDFETAVRLESSATSEKADDWTRLGEIRVRQQRLDEALNRFDDALHVVPDYQPALLWRGVVLVQLKRYQEALAAFDKYEKHGRPTLEFFLTRGMCRAGLARYPDAIADFSRAIDLAPTADTYSKRGWLYALRGNPLIALADFERALELDPEYPDGRCGRGLVLARLARTDDAVKDAEKYLTAAPQSSQSFYKAACIFAVASSRAPTLPNRNPRQTKELRERYLVRAVALIERSVMLEVPENRSNFWRHVIENDAHLQPLRDTPEFASLRTRFLAKNTSAQNTSASTESSQTNNYVRPSTQN